MPRPAAAAAAPSTGSVALDTAWARLQASYGALAPYRDASLDRWHARTALSSGGNALRGGAGLRALAQSISSQVAAVVRDPAKVVARTQMTRAARPRRLCSLEAVAAPAQGGAASDADEEEEGGFAGAGGDVRDTETFDDGEFYQQLLKEFLERSAGALGSLGHDLAKSRGVKKRKQVDRRASKGRKIRWVLCVTVRGAGGGVCRTCCVWGLVGEVGWRSVRHKLV